MAVNDKTFGGAIRASSGLPEEGGSDAGGSGIKCVHRRIAVSSLFMKLADSLVKKGTAFPNRWQLFLPLFCPHCSAEDALAKDQGQKDEKYE